MPGRVVAAIGRPMVSLALGGLLLGGCLGRAQGFSDWNAAWQADLSDRTGTVASIHVLQAPGSGSDLPSDGVRLRSIAPSVVEVAWAGGACLDCAHFSLAPGRGADVALRYDLGPTCLEPAAIGYAFEIRFVHPIDVRSITTDSSWGP